MKYVIVLCDGMADEVIDSLGGKTPLEYAITPNMDMLAKSSMIGLVKTVPSGFSPGSDTANLSVLGYDPNKYYSGRSPLEALSIGVKLKDTDIAIRTNFVTLSENGSSMENQIIIDHSSQEISTEDAKILLNVIKENFDNEEFRFYLGTSYRHLLIWNKGEKIDLVQPHDVLMQEIKDKLPTNRKLKDMMIKSYDLLRNHPINIKRKSEGKNPANCIWFWGAGTRPELKSFEETTKLKGAMISAVDLLKGIAIGAKMKVINVEGANGGLDTNYTGKMEAAVNALLNDEMDFTYIHIEAPDEMGHQGNLSHKIEAIEKIDKYVIGPLYNKLVEARVDFKIMILPDHPTPIRIRTHTSEPVPFMIYDSTTSFQSDTKYNEKTAKASEIFVESGPELSRLFFNI